MLRATAKGFRLHIGFFGRRNVGKSSLLNAITRQTVSIVSDVPGTTTDPVEKPMELAPIGPVLFVDTAGVDDVGALGTQRIEKTRQVIARTDIGVLVTEAGVWDEFEERLLDELRGKGIPVLLAVNKADLGRPKEWMICVSCCGRLLPLKRQKPQRLCAILCHRERRHCS
ncbi:MAG TPA: GTPase [Terracidiphilus sp.]|jgi:small GTP-binding protein